MNLFDMEKFWNRDRVNCTNCQWLEKFMFLIWKKVADKTYLVCLSILIYKNKSRKYLVPQNTVPSGDISSLWLFTVTWCIELVTELMKTVSGVQIMSEGCFVPTMMVNVLFKGCFNRWSFHVCRKNMSTVYIWNWKCYYFFSKFNVPRERI